MEFFRKKLNKKGFTLIELIVVIAILAILAAIAVPRLVGFQDTAKIQANKQVAAQVKNAIALLMADGRVKVATNTGAGNEAYMSIASGGAVTLTVSGTADYTAPAGASLAAQGTAMTTLLGQLVTNLTLNPLGTTQQIICVKILDTEIDVVTTNTGTAPSAADYTE